MPDLLEASSIAREWLTSFETQQGCDEPTGTDGLAAGDHYPWAGNRDLGVSDCSATVCMHMWVVSVVYADLQRYPCQLTVGHVPEPFHIKGMKQQLLPVLWCLYQTRSHWLQAGTGPHQQHLTLLYAAQLVAIQEGGQTMPHSSLAGLTVEQMLDFDVDTLAVKIDRHHATTKKGLLVSLGPPYAQWQP